MSKRGPRRTADARLVRRPDEWQRDALTYYEDLPEVGFAVDYKAQAVAACAWQVVYDDPDVGERPVDDEEVEGLISALRGPVGDEQELRRRAAVLVETTGEAWLLGSAVPDGEAEDGEPGTWWEFLSVLEVVPPGSPGAPWLRSRDGQAKEPIPPDAYQSRLYRPSAAYSALAHSALRRCLGTCQELDMLNRMSAAVITSRLPMGLLLIPESMTWLSPLHRVDETAGLSPDGEPEQQDFMDALMEHMSAPVTDPGSAASITPIVVQGTKDEIGAVKVVELARQLDARVRDMRSELTERLAVGMDIPPEILQGKGGLNHWCVDDATEALTKDGWRTHDRLRRGDIVLTLNHSTGLAEWQPVEQVARFDVHDLPMVRIEGNTHSSFTTRNHRWPVLKKRRLNLRGPAGKPTTRVVGKDRTWATSETLNSNDSIVTAAPVADLPVEAKWDDALVELVAWYWTEGTCRLRPGRDAPQVVITQSHGANPENCARIRRALAALYGPASAKLGSGGRGASRRDDTPRWREVPHATRDLTDFRLNAAAAAPLVAIGPDRVVDLGWVRELTAAQLDLFIDVSVRGDGSKHRTSPTRYLAQKRPEMIAAFELACILSGRTVTTADRVGYGHAGWWTKRSATVCSAAIYGTAAKHAREMTYTGTVWCPTTPNGTWLARRDGTVYFTGNTGWSVDADFLFRHVKPLGDLICQFITMEYLRPLLAEMGRPDVGRYSLVFDPAPLASRDDDDSKATTMFDRGLLSERETVSRQGWDPDAVMPDEAETARRRAWRLVEERILTPTVEGLEALGLDPAWFDLGAPETAPAVEADDDGGEDVGPPGRNSGPPDQDDADGALPGDQALAALVGRLAERADAAVERAGERALNRAKNDRRRAGGNAAGREVTGFVDLTDAEIGTLRPVIRDDPAFRELADAAGEAIWATVRGTQRRRAARPTARQADDIAVAARGFAEAVAGWTADALRTGWDRSSPGGHRVPLVLVEQPVAMFFGAGPHRKAA